MSRQLDPAGMQSLAERLNQVGTHPQLMAPFKRHQAGQRRA